MGRSEYNPGNPDHQATCLRTACAARDPHPGGRHLDQRDELYDGPYTTLHVLPVTVRGSAWKILHDAPALMPELMDLAHEVEHLRRQLGHARADKDQQVEAALRRSESCEHHGEEIRHLGNLLDAATKARDRGLMRYSRPGWPGSLSGRCAR